MMTNLSAPARRAVATLLGLALVLSACGSDGDDDAADDETTTTTTAPAETEDTEAAAPADGIGVELGEWFLDMPATLDAGPQTFALSNVSDEFPHAFAIARGTAYEDLPLKEENGAVDTDALGDDFIGTSDNIEAGATGSIDFDLEAGDYVFFCPIEFGPNSHAAAGQVLSVSVG